MSEIIEITFECIQPDEGQRRYRVIARLGSTGENPPRFTLFDGHSMADAQVAMRKACTAAVKGHKDRLRG